MLKLHLALLVLLNTIPLFADAKVKVTDSGSGYGVEICNETNSPLIVQGYRLETGATKLASTTGGSIEESSSKTNVYQGKVWQHDVNIPHDIANSACRSKEDLSYDASGTLLETGSQVLVQTGTCNGRFGFPDGGIFACTEEVDRELRKSSFYQKDLCLSNELGKNAGSVSGGWINTWGKQTQVQFVPSSGFRINSTDIRWDPGTALNSPMYAMSLATIQEMFGMESQYIAAAAMKETWLGSAGSGFTNSTVGRTATGSGWVSGFGQDDKTGPVHMTLLELVKVIQAYPQFFPNHTCASTVTDIVDAETACGFTDGDAAAFGKFYLLTDGELYVKEDSPKILNAFLAAGLNMHYQFDKLRLSTDLCFAELLTNGADKEAALKFLPGMYRTPKGTDEVAILKNPNILTNANITPLTYSGDLDYALQLDTLVDTLVYASTQSEACGGSNKVFDIPIKRSEIQEFFFGTGGSVDKQGDGGLLLHFDKSKAKRQELSDNLDCIFDKLKGKAKAAGVATTADDEISFRYDFLTLLRVAKGSLSDGWPLDRGFPRQQAFKEYVESNSQGSSTCAGANIDTQYPWFSVSSPVHGAEVKPTFDMSVAAEDDITKEVHIEYTFSEKWAGWVTASAVADSTSYTFQVDCSVEGYPAEGETKDYWVRISDDCNNSVIQKHRIKANNELCGPPKVIPAPLTAVLTDEDGDGVADKLVLNFDAEFEDGLPDSTKIAWPNSESIASLELDSSMIDATVKTKLTKVDNITKELATGGKGSITVFYTDRRGNVKSFSVDITDKMGPVISRAYKLDVIGNNDSLFLVFSEEIKDLSDVSKALLGQTQSKPSFALNNVVSISKQSGVTYLVVLPKGILESGDQIRFAPVSVGGVVEDSFGNAIHENNPWVEVSLVGKLLTPISGRYLDENEDGKLDKVEILYSEELTSNAPKVAQLEFFWPDASGSVKRWVPSLSELSVQDRTLIWTPSDSIKFHPEKTGIEEGYGEGNHSQGIQEDSGDIRDTTISITMVDKMKPVIIRATLNQSNAFETKPDTVQTYFSEKVVADSIISEFDLFQFKRGKEVKAEFVPQRVRVRPENVRLSFGPGTEVEVRPNLGDSIAFKVGPGFLVDSAGNEPATKYVELSGKGGARWFSKGEDMNFIPSKEETEICSAVALPAGAVITDYIRNDSLPTGVLFSIPLADDENFNADEYNLRWTFEHFTNLGGFVSKCAKQISCNNPMFGSGDCRGRTIHLIWNGLSQSKSPVFSGVFLRKFNYWLQASKDGPVIKGEGENNIGILRRE